jgi:cytochrome c oxidase assembly factor CtaG
MRLLASLLLLIPAPALAHEGAQAGWTLDLWVVGPLLLSALLYGIGFARLWRRSDHGRAALRRSAGLFASGWLVLAASVVSPLHEAGERSFAMHMIEHELIMLPAALLLVASRPGAAMLWAFPAEIRAMFGAAAGLGKGLWRGLTDPLVATAVQALAMLAWHAPSLFDRALQGRAWHISQHLCFLLSALLFWWAMAHGRSGRRGYGVAAMCLFATSLVGGALGALMTFAASPWYEGYAALGMTPAGLTPAEDQQLAGLLMWIPGGLFHAAAALYFLRHWLGISEVRDAVPAE